MCESKDYCAVFVVAKVDIAETSDLSPPFPSILLRLCDLCDEA